MRLVVVESPFAGDVERNRLYLKAAMLDCLRRGEAPFASRALYTQVLDDLVPAERRLGMEAGFAWGALAEAVVVYTDFAISPGMQAGIDRAIAAGKTVEYRNLGVFLEPKCTCLGLSHRDGCPEWVLPL
jgi:hypothetical protein